MDLKLLPSKWLNRKNELEAHRNDREDKDHQIQHPVIIKHISAQGLKESPV